MGTRENHSSFGGLTIHPLHQHTKILSKRFIQNSTHVIKHEDLTQCNYQRRNDPRSDSLSTSAQYYNITMCNYFSSTLENLNITTSQQSELVCEQKTFSILIYPRH